MHHPCATAYSVVGLQPLACVRGALNLLTLLVMLLLLQWVEDGARRAISMFLART